LIDANAIHEPITLPRKEGYLFKRTTPPMGASVWLKRYFVLEEGRLVYSFLLNFGKKKGCIGAIESINVLLCSIRLYQSEERRFCFQVLNPKK
jgi:hypothetical protein